MPCRGIRGATTVKENSPNAILAATIELLQALSVANELQVDDIASAIFTATPDLDAAFPARAARELGWTKVALLDAVEIAVPGALPRCIRVLIHWNTNRPANAIHHIYLREAARLRPDLAASNKVTSSQTSPDISPNRDSKPITSQAKSTHHTLGREL